MLPFRVFWPRDPHASESHHLDPLSLGSSLALLPCWVAAPTQEAASGHTPVRRASPGKPSSEYPVGVCVLLPPCGHIFFPSVSPKSLDPFTMTPVGILSPWDLEKIGCKTVSPTHISKKFSSAYCFIFTFCRKILASLHNDCFASSDFNMKISLFSFHTKIHLYNTCVK